MLHRSSSKRPAGRASRSLADRHRVAAELRYAHVGAEGDIQTIYAAEAAEGHRRRHQRRSDRSRSIREPARRRRRDGRRRRMGSISMGHHDFASLARLVPEVAVFNAPFIYRDGAHALAATDPATSPALQAINEKLVAEGGVRIIGRIYRGAARSRPTSRSSRRPISPASRSAPCRSSCGSRWSRASARCRPRSRSRNCRPR